MDADPRARQILLHTPHFPLGVAEQGELSHLSLSSLVCKMRAGAGRSWGPQPQFPVTAPALVPASWSHSIRPLQPAPLHALGPLSSLRAFPSFCFQGAPRTRCTDVSTNSALVQPEEEDANAPASRPLMKCQPGEMMYSAGDGWRPSSFLFTGIFQFLFSIYCLGATLVIVRVFYTLHRFSQRAFPGKIL